jgi:hypothetical protein
MRAAWGDRGSRIHERQNGRSNYTLDCLHRFSVGGRFRAGATDIALGRDNRLFCPGLQNSLQLQNLRLFCCAAPLAFLALQRIC